MKKKPKTKEKNPGGRPLTYSEAIIRKAKEYVDNCEDREEQQLVGLSAKGTEMYKNKIIVSIPTIEGLALFLDVNRDTLYDWEKKYKMFSDILNRLRAKQAKALIEKHGNVRKAILAQQK